MATFHLFECTPVVFLALALAASPALADGPSSEASVEARRDEAKARFRRGSEKYESGHYQEAVQAFMEADQLAPSPALSFNIARVYERLNDTSGALRWYRDYLRRSPNAKNAPEVRQKVAALSSKLSQSGLQQLTVLSMPVGAAVAVDGRDLGVTPFTGDLALGQHRVSLALPGYRDFSDEVLLAADSPREVTLNLEQEARSTAAPTAATGTLADRAPGRRFGLAPWLIAGTGVASLTGALGFELARRSHQSSAKSAPDQLIFKDQADAMERDKTTARVLFGVGGALVVIGSVMLVFNQEAGASNAPRVGLGCSFSGCTASARGTF